MVRDTQGRLHLSSQVSICHQVSRSLKVDVAGFVQSLLHNLHQAAACAFQPFLLQQTLPVLQGLSKDTWAPVFAACKAISFKGPKSTCAVSVSFELINARRG